MQACAGGSQLRRGADAASVISGAAAKLSGTLAGDIQSAHLCRVWSCAWRTVRQLPLSLLTSRRMSRLTPPTGVNARRVPPLTAGQPGHAGHAAAPSPDCLLYEGGRDLKGCLW